MFSYVNKDGLTVVIKSNGVVIFKVKDGKVCIMENGTKFIAEHLGDTAIGEKKIIASVPFEKIGKNGIRFVDTVGNDKIILE